MHPQKRLHLLIEGEVDEHRPRPGEHHREGRDRPLGLSEADMTEGAPVDLRLLPRARPRRAGTPSCCAGRARRQPPSEHGDAVRVATLLDLLPEPGRGHLRIRRQPLQQVRLERVEPGGCGGRVLGRGLVGNRATAPPSGGHGSAGRRSRSSIHRRAPGAASRRASQVEIV